MAPAQSDRTDATDHGSRSEAEGTMLGLFTDLYELTMAQAYWREEMFEPAVFTLSARRLPATRNFLLACGLDTALDALERVRFGQSALEYLERCPEFHSTFLEWLAGFRFDGTIRAMPEGTPVFGEEPLLEVEAPLPHAQLVETLLLNRVHVETLVASKAIRMVLAASGRRVIDFGMRRAHGMDAALYGARASYVAGVAATSNVLAGYRFAIPIVGTMAHSYVQAHASELDAYRQFSRLYPDTVLLVDTYDSIEGVERVIALARELGDAFHVQGVRLDSGDLGSLASAARALLDQANLTTVRIVASGGLDEYGIAKLMQARAPIDTFAVGTALLTSSDSPALDMVYKLAAYAGRARLKLSSGKRTLPGAKQVYRLEREGRAVYDTITRAEEEAPGIPLLHTVMQHGRRVSSGSDSLAEIRRRASNAVQRLPPPLLSIEPAEPPYEVRLGAGLVRERQALERLVRRQELGT